MSRYEIPESWRWIRLSSIADIVGGGTPRRNIPRYFGGDIPWATPTDVTSLDGIHILETAETITEAGLANSAARLLPENSVLMTSRATIGVTAIAKCPMATNQGFVNFICNDELLESEYLARYLAWATDRLIRLAYGTTFKEISRSTLKRFELPLPTLPEQREIVKILRQADRLRQLRAQADKQTDLLALSTFNDIFGFIDKTAPYRQVKLERVADIVSGVTKGRNLPSHETMNVPYLRVANVQDGYLDLSELKTIDVLSSDVEKYTLQLGDVLLTEGGDFDKLGRGAIWEHDIQNCIHQNHVFRVRVAQETLHPLFFNYYLQTAYARHYFLRSAKRTTNLASINKTQLGALPVPIPPMPMQKKFVNAVNQIRSILTAQENTRMEIDQLARAVMVRAFMGELTQGFREENQSELAILVAKRDVALKEPSRIVEAHLDETEHEPTRILVRDMLSHAQQALLTLIENQDAYVTGESSEIEDNMTPNEAGRNLDLLQQLGFIKAASISVTPGELGQIFFTKTYRALQSDDHKRDEDLSILHEAQEE